MSVPEADRFSKASRTGSAIRRHLAARNIAQWLTVHRRRGLRRSLHKAAATAWSIEVSRRTPFHLLPIGLGVGIVLTYGAGLSIHFILALGLALAFSAAAMASRRVPARNTLLAFLAALFAGLALAGMELAGTKTTIFSGEATVHITAKVVSHERDERGRSRYILDLMETRRPVLSRPPERVRILVAARHAPLAPGAIYEGLVRLRPPSGPAMPGAHNFAFRPYFEGLGAYGFALGAPDPAAVGRAPSSLADRSREWLAATRGFVTERIRAAIDGPAGGVAAALVTGERQGITPQAEETLRATGLAHILSISGLHLALVSGVAMLLVRRSLVLVRPLVLLAPIRKIAAGAAIGIATGYLFLSGANVATERAYVMLVVMLLAVLCDRQAITLRSVSLAALIVLILTPHAVMTASFQMSFAATAALVGAYGVWMRGRVPSHRTASLPAFLWRLIWTGLAATFVTSLVAGAATAPYAAYHFQRVAPFGLVANLLTMPLFTFWVMPAALIGTLLVPIGLDAPVFAFMGYGLDLVLAIAALVAGTFPDKPTGAMSTGSLVVLTLALLVFSCAASRARWLAVPLILFGLFLFPTRAPLPELLVFEDGEEIALVDGDAIVPLTPRPSRFVVDQWERALGRKARPPRASDGRGDMPAPDSPSTQPAACDDSDLRAKVGCPPNAAAPSAPPPGGQGTAVAEPSERSGASSALDCSESCLLRTRSGLRVFYTTDWRRMGEACDRADIAIVARAIRADHCRSGAALVTLRTLRRTGSLAIRRDGATGAAAIETAVPDHPLPWNRHRLAPWPEYWRKPLVETPPMETDETTNTSATYKNAPASSSTAPTHASSD